MARCEWNQRVGATRPDSNCMGVRGDGTWLRTSRRPGILPAYQGDAMRFSVIAIAAALIVTPAGLTPVWAQEAPPAAPAAEAAAPLQLELIDTLSSKTAKRGDMFNMRLSAPAVVDGQ